ncbi:MAG: hypothetical protein NDI69_01785 [Bacteriovoracaceae bacterium]|nr:hypothetical protein [Bacteriovoracaceae bacterium]
MKNTHVFTVCLSVLLSTPLLARDLSQKGVEYVPKGMVVENKTDEVKIKTANGGIVEVEFTRDGELDEASGDSVIHDEFVPGQGLLSLKEAVQQLQENGKNPSGDWSLKNSFIKGWHYEFEGIEAGKSMDYVLDAKTGKLLESKRDD